MVGDSRPAGLVPVHLVDPASWREVEGWLNVAAVAVVQPFRLDLAGVLCEACSARVAVPPTLAVRLLDGSRLLVAGDGVHDDAEALTLLRRARRARQRCEREQHPGGAGSFLSR